MDFDNGSGEFVYRGLHGQTATPRSRSPSRHSVAYTDRLRRQEQSVPCLPPTHTFSPPQTLHFVDAPHLLPLAAGQSVPMRSWWRHGSMATEEVRGGGRRSIDPWILDGGLAPQHGHRGGAGVTDL